MRFLETIRCEGRRPLHLSYHQARLDRTLKAFKIQHTYNLEALILPPEETLLRCRFLYDAGGYRVTYHPYSSRSFKRLQAVIDDDLTYAYKYTDRHALDTLYQQRGQSDEIVIVQRGLLTDATIANIALYDGHRWLTPKRPLLHGTTRERLLHEGFLSEADIPLHTLGNFERCALLNAMLGFFEVECGIMAPQ